MAPGVYAMTRWHVAYGPYFEGRLDGIENNPFYRLYGGASALGAAREIPCFRIFPENEPERWLVETNPALPREVQEENAFYIAEALSKVFG